MVQTQKRAAPSTHKPLRIYDWNPGTSLHGAAPVVTWHRWEREADGSEREVHRKGWEGCWSSRWTPSKYFLKKELTCSNEGSGQNRAVGTQAPRTQSRQAVCRTRRTTAFYQGMWEPVFHLKGQKPSRIMAPEASLQTSLGWKIWVWLNFSLITFLNAHFSCLSVSSPLFSPSYLRTEEKSIIIIQQWGKHQARPDGRSLTQGVRVSPWNFSGRHWHTGSSRWCFRALVHSSLSLCMSGLA